MTQSQIVLASGSPRRRQLLQLIGIDFDVVPADIDERSESDENPVAYACRTAREKALHVAGRHRSRPVLGADTVVEIDGAILGKPGSRESAGEMLRSLSGRVHQVHTALALVVDGTSHELVDTANVHFVDLNDRLISWYVEGEEPMDKAGAYAVQGIGGLFVERVEGSPQTVIGLPIHRLPELFAAHGLDFWSLLVP